jgi:hypothetical protein
MGMDGVQKFSFLYRAILQDKVGYGWPVYISHNGISKPAVLGNIVYFTSLVFPAEFLQRRRAQKKNRATNQVKVPLPGQTGISNHGCTSAHGHPTRMGRYGSRCSPMEMTHGQPD